ncbi:MAG: hypothetical protein JHC40_20760 [Burkholderiales bacterium]|jgi:hypothetical protein|nr:hypothetical protein [Burkholderiales bacterium]
MKLVQLLCVGLSLVLTGQSGKAQDCGQTISGSLEARIEKLRALFVEPTYVCSLTLIVRESEALESLADREGIDARFAIRELILDLVEDASKPVDRRLELLQAWTANTPPASKRPSTEILADVAILVNAAESFGSLEGMSGSLGATLLAVRTHQSLPTTARKTPSWIFSIRLPGMDVHMHVGGLAALAEQVRGDKLFEHLRSRVAHVTYYNVPAMKPGEAPQLTFDRCTNLIRLVEALDGDDPNLPSNWQWRPIMESGAAFAKLGRTNEANRQIGRAIGLVRGIKDKNTRLYAYISLLSSLLQPVQSGYPRDVALDVVNEMKQLISTSDSKMTKEMREMVAGTLKHWNVDAGN